MARSAAFNKLKSLNLTKRMQMAQDTTVGRQLLSLLTPSEFADLFPKYYQKQLPDVGGFRLAISQKTAQQQTDYAQQLQDRLVGIERDAAESKKSYAQKFKEWAMGGGKKNQPPPNLTPEQEAAWNAITSGQVSATSEYGKLFSKFNSKELSSMGIVRTKSSSGLDVFSYEPPRVSDEDAIRALNASRGKGNLAQNQAIAYRELRSLGYDDSGARGAIATISGESLKDPTDTHPDASRSDPTQVAHGIVSWSTKRANRIAREYPGANGRLPNQMSLQEQVRVFDWELKKDYPDLWRRMRDPNISAADKSMMLTKEFERPADKEAQAKDRVNRFLGNITTEFIDPSGPNNQWSGADVDKMRKKMESESNPTFKARYAQKLAEMISNSPKDVMTETSGKATGKQPTVLGSTGYCARGVVHLSKQLFAGNEYFDGTGIHGKGHAYQFTNSNNWLTNSGMYKMSGTGMTKDQFTQEYRDSLPPYSVVAMGGGKGGKFGHIEMKMPDGTWASDFKQRDFIGLHDNHPTPYQNFAVMTMTDQGRAQAAKNGWMFPDASAAQTTTAPAGQTPQSAAITPTSLGEETYVNPEPTPEEYNIDKQQIAAAEAAKTTTNPTEKKKLEEFAAKPTNEMTTNEKQIIQQGPAVSPNPGPAPAVAPVNSGPQIGRYKVDPEAFREASKPGAAREGYPGFMVNMASHQDLIDGFNKNKDAIAAGASISNDWVLTVKNKNDPKVKAILEEYKGNVLTEMQDKQAMREDATVTTKLATAAQAINPVQPATAAELNMNDPEVRRKIEEQHKANIEKQKAQSASLPEGKSGGGATPAKAPETKPGTPAETAKSVTPTATVNPPAPAKVATAEDIKAMGIMMPKVPGASTGGSFDTNGQPVSFYPMDKRDDIAAINPITQQPLFTAQSAETIHVNPNQKNNNIDQQPQNPMMTEINNIYNMMQEGFTQTGHNTPDAPIQRLPQDRADDNPGMIKDLNNITAKPFQSPSFYRAMTRTRGQETGDGTNDHHFSYGNKS